MILILLLKAAIDAIFLEGSTNSRDELRNTKEIVTFLKEQQRAENRYKNYR